MATLEQLEWDYFDAEQAFINAFLTFECKENEHYNSSVARARRRAMTRNRKIFVQATIADKVSMVPSFVEGSRYESISKFTANQHLATDFIHRATIYAIAKSKGVGAAVLWKLSNAA